MAARGKPVTVKLDMTSSFNPRPRPGMWSARSGPRAPDEVIVVGGHLDSWDSGHRRHRRRRGRGDHDRGGEAGRRRAPRRTIRVVMFGSEEQGGSRAAYANAHKVEIGKIVVAGESDDGAGLIWSLSLPRRRPPIRR
jgi:hypothetical protein